MAKQEEIREGIAVRLYWKDHPVGDWSVELPETKAIYYIRANVALSYLHDNGVVIKVERELPFQVIINDAVTVGGSKIDIPNEVLKSAGYEAIESLVEKK